jgi:hypothetical protein
MNILITVKKLGNHWYPNLEHEDPMDLMLDPKMEKLLTLWDQHNIGELHFLLSEVHTWVEPNTIQFKDEDIWKWLNTTTTFPITLYIGDHEFEISTAMMDLFESQFNTNFHKTLYSINLCNM